jgi:hypothetical protein
MSARHELVVLHCASPFRKLPGWTFITDSVGRWALPSLVERDDGRNNGPNPSVCIREWANLLVTPYNDRVTSQEFPAHSIQRTPSPNDNILPSQTREIRFHRQQENQYSVTKW